MSSIIDSVSMYLHENITKNVKQLMATLGSMILTLLATIIFIVKSGFGIQDAFIVVLLELQPFCYIYIKLIFSGEANLKDQQILVLEEKLGSIQELSEYKIKLAARDALILANDEWNKINDKIAALDARLEKKE